MKKLVVMILVLAMMINTMACAGQTTETAVGAPDTQNEGEEEAEPEAASEEETKRIYFINSIRAMDYFVYIEAGAKRMAEKMGYEMVCVDANGDTTKQSDFISQAVVEGYDAILVGGDATLIPAVEEANAAGIPVLNYDSPIGAEAAGLVASDNMMMGKQAGEYAVELLKEKYDGEVKGRVIYINFPIASMQDRCAGFVEAFAEYPDVVLEEQVPQAQFVDECSILMENVLTANAEGTLDIVFGSNSGAALGAIAAAGSSGRTDVMMVGIDDEDGQLNALKDSESPYYMTVAQDPITIGELSIEAIGWIFAGEEVGNVTVDARVVTKDNVKEFVANEQQRKDDIAPYK